MTINLLTTVYPQKGISIYSEHLIRSLAKQSINLNVYAYKRPHPGFLHPDGIDDKAQTTEPYPINVTIRKKINWFNPLGWLFEAAQMSGEILHIQYWTFVQLPVFLTFSLAARLKKMKVVITLHNIRTHEFGNISTKFIKTLFFFCDNYIVHNDNNKQLLSKEHHVPLNKISVIPIGVYHNNKFVKINTAKARENLGLEINKKYILFAGHIRKYKGLETLLMALPPVIKHISDARLLIVGSVWGSWQSYQKIIDSLQLDKYIIRNLNYVSDQELSQWICASDIVVLPYKKFESSSGLAKTILFFEKPMLVSRVGDLPELVPYDDMTFEPGRQDELANCLATALTKTENEKMIEYIKAIKANYSWEKIGENYRKYYKTITAKNEKHNY